MTDQQHGSPPAPTIRRRRMSPIWALPIVAGLVAAWLGYTTFASQGPTITIGFKTATGLVAGKTLIKHHDIELGLVDAIVPAPDLSSVTVSVKMNKTATQLLREGTHFWVARPRISLSGLSGLDTLVGGSYIEMDPGPAAGKNTRSFAGLEEPPVVQSDVVGTTYILTTDKIGSVGSGSPVFFRGIEVGQVINYEFAGVAKGFSVRIFVRQPYDAYVREGTHFWNASGISLTTGADGFKLNIESLAAVIGGGIAFDTIDTGHAVATAKADTSFILFDDHAAVEESSFTSRTRVIVEFDGSVRGLDVGSPVEMLGIRIGRVIEYHLVIDAATKKIRVPVVIELAMERAQILNLPSAQLGNGALAMGLVSLGMRAQLQTASLLTGQLLVALDFFPDAPPATITLTDTYPKFPTVPAQMVALTRSIGSILDKLAALPLDDLTKNLGSTLDSARALLKTTDSSGKPLIASLQQTSDAAQLILQSMKAGYGEDSQVRSEATTLLIQLQAAAKSITTLANYLDEHPESLLRGKASP